MNPVDLIQLLYGAGIGWFACRIVLLIEEGSEPPRVVESTWGMTIVLAAIALLWPLAALYAGLDNTYCWIRRNL